MKAPNFSARYMRIAPDSNTRIGVAPLRSTSAGIFEFGFAATKPLLSEADDDKEPCRLLERVLESTHSTAGIRDATLDLLRSHYDAAERPREVIRVLDKVISLDPAAPGQ